jgi:hypothetical protein
VELVVQNSNVRRFKAEEYAENGLTLVDSVDDCDVLLGVKEVNMQDLIPNKKYFFFSHTTKKQPYNRELLKTMIDKKITMVDYEGLTNEKGSRLIGFGKYAGIVGCYNSFFTYGKKTNAFDLKRAYLCEDRAEMEKGLSKIKLPNDFKIVTSGGGRVASGITEILNKIGIKKVSSTEILENNFNEVKEVLNIINSQTKDFKNMKNIDKTLANRYEQKLEDIQQWLNITEWNDGKPITKNLITRIQNKMVQFNVIEEKKNSGEFIKNMYI